MAEKSFETPHHFLEHVIIPNIEEWEGEQNSLRLAFNAVMSIDSFAAHILEYKKKRGDLKANLNDSDFKKNISKDCEAFQIVSDVAKALKHVELNNKKSVVKSATDTSIGKTGYGLGIYGAGPCNGDRVITVVEGQNRPLLDDCRIALKFLEKLLES